MQHFQDMVKRAQEEAKKGDIELTLYLDPFAEYETDQLGYCPTMALDLFTYYIPLGTVAASGEVNINTIKR